MTFKHLSSLYILHTRSDLLQKITYYSVLENTILCIIFNRYLSMLPLRSFKSSKYVILIVKIFDVTFIKEETVTLVIGILTFFKKSQERQEFILIFYFPSCTYIRSSLLYLIALGKKQGRPCQKLLFRVFSRALSSYIYRTIWRQKM